MTSVAKRAVLAAALFLVLLPAPARGQTIAVQGDHFTVDRNDGNGPRARFLLFISYFDALRATDPAADLEYIANTLHFDGVRILPNWRSRTSAYCEDSASDLLFDIDGNVRGDGSSPSGPLKRLIDLVAAAATRGLIVDVTFTRATVDANMTGDNYLRAVTRVATLLRPYRNVIFDLDNEVQNNGTAEADIRRIRDAILANPDPTIGDASRIVTVSRSGPVTDVVGYNQRTGMSAIAYHDERFVGTWQNNVPAVVAALRPSGLPVYLQEPMPWNSGLSICGSQEPSPKEADGDAAHFRSAVANARTAGAAAWTFHTRQSFRLDAGGTFKERLQGSASEKALLEGDASTPALSVVAASGAWGIDTTLTVEVTGTGDGTVTSSPAGIACGLTGSACSATFPPGTVVTLTPSAATGSEFVSWNGCAGAPACSVTLNTSLNVSARFTAVEQVFYYDLDAVGSTRLITDAGGAVVSAHDYTPFGVEMTASNGFTPRLFAGKQRDGETGLDYFGARYYQAGTARFTTVDPVYTWKENVEEPRRWNRYAYVWNNPLRYIDPTGMIGCEVDGKETKCRIEITYDPKTSRGRIIVYGMFGKEERVLLDDSIVVGGNGKTPLGTFTASYWEKDHVSTKYGWQANTKWSESPFGINAFGPYQLHIKELEARGIWIHGTMGPGKVGSAELNRLVSPTSHGCVRCSNPTIIRLHELMPNPRGNQILIRTFDPK